MIEFGKGFNSDTASFEKAEIGDIFVIIEYASFSRHPTAIIQYSIIKIGKRDIICRSAGGRELKINRNKEIWPCYPVDSSKVSEIRKQIAQRNRRHKCQKLIEHHQEFDDELMAAIEAFAERMSKGE